MSSGSFNWTFAGAPVSVQLDLAVVERLRRQLLAAEDDERGVLLGTTFADSPIRIRVTGFRPAVEGNILEALRESRAGPEAPVGYYRFPGHGRIRLDPDDLALADSCFSDPARIFLVARVDPSGEASAGIFFWDDGRIHADFSFLEFPLSADSLREPRPGLPPARKLPRALAAVGAVSLLTLLAMVIPWRAPSAGMARGEELGLRYDLLGSQVRVAWDKSLPQIATARSGALSIQEGRNETIVPLAGDQLRTGAVFYTRVGGAELVRFRLDVTGAAQRVSQLLIASFPPIHPAASPYPRGTASRAEPPEATPAPKPFQPPSSAPVAAARRPDLPDLPAISLPTASRPDLPAPAPATPPAPPPSTPAPATVPPPVKESVYIPPKPLNVLRPTLPSTVASVLRTKTRIQVKVRVDATGKVLSAEPLAVNSTTQVPASYVVAASRHWRFEPARRDGVAVPAEVTVNVDFEAGGK